MQQTGKGLQWTIVCRKIQYNSECHNFHFLQRLFHKIRCYTPSLNNPNSYALLCFQCNVKTQSRKLIFCNLHLFVWNKLWNTNVTKSAETNSRRNTQNANLCQGRSLSFTCWQLTRHIVLFVLTILSFRYNVFWGQLERKADVKY